jgi:ABC-type branched-subunit amino acid transport system substrate-binding protein
MRFSLLRATLVASSILAMSATAFAQAKEPYRVALIAAKTGGLATVLGPAGTGFEAYIDKINKAGGIDGHAIKLDLLDEQSTPAVANGLFQRVLSDPPVAMAFFGQSTSQTQSRQLLENAGLPVLTVTADDSFLYPKPTKTMFQLNASATQQAYAFVAMAEAKLGDLKGKKVATASVQTTFSDAIVKVIGEIGAQKGFTVATSERFPAGIPSFASQGAKIARENPDAVFVLSGNADGPLVIKAISDAGVTAAPIIGYVSISSNEVFQKVGLPNYHAFRTSNVATDIPALMDEMKGSPYATDMGNTWWASGWITAYVLAESLKKCGDGCTGEKLIEAIEGAGAVDVPNGLLFGPVHFTADNHAGLSKAQGYKWDGGAVVADGDPVQMGSN